MTLDGADHILPSFDDGYKKSRFPCRIKVSGLFCCVGERGVLEM